MTTGRGPNLFLCAAEASGDQLGAELVDELRRRHPALEVAGLAGPRMRASGVHAVARAEDATGLGLVEVIRKVPAAIKRIRHLERAVLRRQPDLVVTIDSPELLTRLGRRVRRLGVPVLHWVSPQIWAWRPNRARHMGRCADAVLCLFPMEPPLYEPHGVRAPFVGHPAVGRTRRIDVSVPGSPVFALVPGSRKTEIDRLWPVFREVADQLRLRFPACGFVVPVAPTVDRRALTGVPATFCDDISVAGSAADAALVTSGTATLELAALGVPMAVVYRVHPLTWAIGRRMVRGVRNVALPNVLAGRQIAPEHLQSLHPTAIADDVAALLGPPGHDQRAELARIVDQLDGDGAIGRVADEVDRWLTERRPPSRPG